MVDRVQGQTSPLFHVAYCSLLGSLEVQDHFTRAFPRPGWPPPSDNRTDLNQHRSGPSGAHRSIALVCSICCDSLSFHDPGIAFSAPTRFRETAIRAKDPRANGFATGSQAIRCLPWSVCWPGRSTVNSCSRYFLSSLQCTDSWAVGPAP